MAFLGPSLRRKRVTDRPAARVATAAVVSLALNAALIVVIARLGAFELTRPVEPTRVALQSLSPEQWQAHRAITGAPAVPAVPPPTAALPPKAVTPPAARPPPDERKAPGQIVDVAPSNDSRAPDKARFASDRNNRVEKETRSRWAGTQVWEKRAPAPVQGARGAQPREAGEGGDAKESRQAKAGQDGTSGKTGKEGPRKPEPSGSDERLAMLERPQAPGLSRPGERQPQAGDEGLGKPGAPGEPQQGQKKAGDPRLLPSAESMSRIAAGPSNDYIDGDVEEGDATALNTKGFKFATFWNRFKQDVVGHWRPAIVYEQRDPDGTMFGGRSERATGLHLVLDANGAIKEIKVVEPSGLDFLDREAVRAVRAAAPFYNVPAGLLDEKGEVSFSFGMVLVMNRAVPVRPRYQPGGL